MAYTPTSPRNSPNETTSDDEGRVPDGFASSVPPAHLPGGRIRV
jgi:hypothetical protein